jgi:spore germination cell wall hydrolase CwlJ-like protein
VESVEKFNLLLQQPGSNNLTCVPVVVDASYRATDADSGTFSSEEDDVMTNVVEGEVNGTADKVRLFT